MPSEGTITWRGKSGAAFRYNIYPIGTSWRDTPGNYIFARRNENGRYTALYIGETGSLKVRLSPITSHEKWDCAVQNGVTHIHAHTSSSDADTRRKEEKDLIDNYNPPCNG